jgi:hypothetical protein
MTPVVYCTGGQRADVRGGGVGALPGGPAVPGPAASRLPPDTQHRPSAQVPGQQERKGKYINI